MEFFGFEHEETTLPPYLEEDDKWELDLMLTDTSDNPIFTISLKDAEFPVIDCAPGLFTAFDTVFDYNKWTSFGMSMMQRGSSADITDFCVWE